MATDINNIKDASGNSINDYKAAYAQAAKEGNAEKMAAANAAANAIRESQNVATESASADISKVQSGGQSGMVTEPDQWDHGTTAPAGYTGSANSVTTYTSEQQKIIDQMNANSIQWHTALHGDVNTPGTKEWYEQQNKNLSAQLGDGVTFDPVTGYWSGSATQPVQQQQVNTGTPNTAGKVSTTDLQALLNQWRDAATTQSQNSVDYAVEKAAADLQRALEDSQSQFKEQQETVSRDEMQGRDNSALYSELRGDKGGIGKEQYDSIQNTAAQNRLAVQQAQTKLATDTQRQIADLRAQGEFEKADAVLGIAQTYLSQLINLEQWAAEYNLSVDQFNESIRQWEAEFKQAVTQYQDSQKLAIAELTGKFSDGTTTLQAQNLVNQQLASSGEALLSYGILPSDEQLAAMGMTREQADQFVKAIQLEKAAAAKGNGGGGDGDTKFEEMSVEEIYQALYDVGYTNRDEASVKAFLMSMGLSSTLAGSYAAAYAGSEYRKIVNALPKVTAVDDPSALKSLQQRLSEIEDSGTEASVPARAKDEIYRAVHSGSISEETAKKLLKQYGYVV